MKAQENCDKTSLEDSNILTTKRFNTPRSRKQRISYKDVWKRVRSKLIKKQSTLDFLCKDRSRPDFFTIVKRSSILRRNQSSDFASLFIIHPQSTVALIMIFLISISVVYICTFGLFFTAFYDTSRNKFVLFIDFATDTIYIVDVLFTLNLAYKDENNVLISNRWKITKNYLKTWLIVDLISSVPISLIKIFLNIEGTLIILLKLIRLRALPKLIQLLSSLARIKNIKIIDDLDYFLSSHKNLMNYLKVLCGLSLSLHLVSCLFYLFAKVDGFSPETWVMRQHYLDNTVTDKYLLCIYWAITTLITVGYGDIVPVTVLEKSLAMIWTMAGVGIVSYSVGALAMVYSKQSLADSITLHTINLAEDLASNTNISKSTLYLVKKSIRQSKTIVPRAPTAALFKIVPIDLKYEIASKLYNGSLLKFPFFSTKSKSFIAEVILKLEPLVFSSKSTLWQAHESSEGIYFVHRGKVHYIYQGHSFISFDEQRYFGDIEILNKQERMFTAVCNENTTLLRLNNSDVQFIKIEFPMFWVVMKNDVKIRTERLVQYLAEKIAIRRVFNAGDEYDRGNLRRDIEELYNILYLRFVNEGRERRIQAIHMNLQETESSIESLSNLVEQCFGDQIVAS